MHHPRLQFFLIPLTLLLFFPRVKVEGQSRSLSDLAFGFHHNANIHLVTHSISSAMEDLVSSSYYTSYHPNETTHHHPSRRRSRRPFPLPRNLVRVENIERTVQLLGLKSPKTTADDDPIVVVWPEAIASQEDAETLLRSPSLENATRPFGVSSSLFFLIPKVDPPPPSSEHLEIIHSSFHLYEVYHINSLQIVQGLSGEGEVDFACINCKGVVLRRSNFQGLHLNIAAFEEPTANDDLHFEKGKKTEAGDWVLSPEGFSSRVLSILQTSLNFTPKIIRSTDRGTFIAANNSWVGAVRDVADGKAELGISISTMTPGRGKLVVFLPPADQSVISAYFLPPNLNAVRDIFAAPFHADLWAATFATWTVLAFFMSFFSVIRKRYKMGEGMEEEPDFARDSLIWALATACQQGWDDHPVAGSLRAIFISGSFTGVVAYAGYSAAIVSTLSLKIDPIQNTDQLVRSPIRVGIRDGFIRELLQQNGTADVITAFQKKLTTTSHPAERYLPVPAGYAHLLNNSFAFISSADQFYDYLKTNVNVTDTDICALKDVRLLPKGFPLGHFVNRDSPYKEFLRYVYVAIREPGVSWKLRSNHSYQRRCLEATDNSGKALGANDVFTAFMILCGGYALSLVFLTVEKLYWRSVSFTYIR